MKAKVVFVVTGYGEKVNGGVEQHCKMLAERLVTDYDVEVLSTCVQNYVKGENEIPAGDEWINGVLVRRFMAEPIHPELHRFYVRKSKWIRKFRKILYQLNILRFIADVYPIWRQMNEIEQRVMQSYMFYSPRLIAHIQKCKNEYKAIIPINISYPLAYYTSLCAPDKTILVPTMHYESSTFRAIYTEVFTSVAYIGFNTVSEQRLAENIFGRRMSPHGLISVGINVVADADWVDVKRKYNLPEEYLLYVGRIDKGKLNHIVQYFLHYKARYANSKLKFVLVGGLFSAPVSHSDLIYTGFVSENEKYAIIRHAKIMVNPSKFESLSLILLEGMQLGKPMLVNGKCEVLKEHCSKSEKAALAYWNKNDFISKLASLETSSELCREMGKKGKVYVETYYSWSVIMERLKKTIESV